jgi:hypothetical protein
MPQRRGDWLVLKSIAVGLALMLAAGAGFVCGSIRGNVQAYHYHFRHQEDAIREVLNSDPAFSRIEVWEAMDGFANLHGDVETEADKERLRAALLKAFGERRGAELAGAVHVRKPKR